MDKGKSNRPHLGMGYNAEHEAGNICEACNGHGIRTYPNTATWHNCAFAGQARTNDVCDVCWGSGKKDVIWPSHLEFQEMKAKLSQTKGNDHE